tara:strand:+ start:1941 stop:2630 length:690 start_codon:yes stop_codon:yes gene_type:complete
MMGKKYLFVVPARAGSKGIVNKNIKMVKGIPLIEYTLKSLETFDRSNVKVVVSSDSEEILSISEKYDVDLALRPAHLSTDNAKTLDLVLYILDEYEKRNSVFSNVMILQPTSPLRSKEDIESSMKSFEKFHGSSLISVYELKGIKETYLYKHKSENSVIPLSGKHDKGLPRQTEGNLFVRNGAIYISEVDMIRKHKKIISNNPIIYQMPKSRSINIDSLEDLKRFEGVA